MCYGSYELDRQCLDAHTGLGEGREGVERAKMMRLVSERRGHRGRETNPLERLLTALEVACDFRTGLRRGW